MCTALNPIKALQAYVRNTAPLLESQTQEYIAERLRIAGASGTPIFSAKAEVLQGFIPVRASGLTDVITNTLGTVIGTMVFPWKITQTIFLRVGIPIER